MFDERARYARLAWFAIGRITDWMPQKVLQALANVWMYRRARKGRISV